MTDVIYTYAIYYNSVQTSHFENKLVAFVKENGKVLAWMRPFLGVYFVKSYDLLYVMQQSFNDFFESQVTFFIQPVHPGLISGIAPTELWNWIAMNTAPEILALQGRG